MKAELLENWTYFWNRVLGAQYLIEQRITEVLADSSIVIPQRYKPKAGTGSSSKSEKNNLELVDVQTEDYCSVLVKFENGVRGVFTVSQVSAGNKNALEIHLDGSLSSGSWKQEEPSILHMGFRGKAGEKVARDPNLLNQAALRGLSNHVD